MECDTAMPTFPNPSAKKLTKLNLLLFLSYYTVFSFYCASERGTLVLRGFDLFFKNRSPCPPLSSNKGEKEGKGGTDSHTPLPVIVQNFDPPHLVSVHGINLVFFFKE